MFRGTQSTSDPGHASNAVVRGLSLSGDPELHGRYLTLLRGGRQDPFMAELFESAIPRGGAVVDGGACLGYHTLLAARRVGLRGKVLAFEPNPATYRALRRNVRQNGYEDRVVALPLGVGAWSGKRAMDGGAAGDGTSGMLAPERWREATTHSRILTLDSSVAGNCIDVVKLDIDGGEVEALRGMRRTLELSPRLRLFVECNPAALVRAGASAGALLDELAELGFEVHVIDESRGALTAAGPWLREIAGRVNLYCETSRIRRGLRRRPRVARRGTVHRPRTQIPA